jgi:hypothetical protein
MLSQEAGNIIASLEEFFAEMASDEAGSPCDQSSHKYALFWVKIRITVKSTVSFF